MLFVKKYLKNTKKILKKITICGIIFIMRVKTASFLGIITLMAANRCGITDDYRMWVYNKIDAIKTALIFKIVRNRFSCKTALVALVGA